jgi:hypothetical protein
VRDLVGSVGATYFGVAPVTPDKPQLQQAIPAQGGLAGLAEHVIGGDEQAPIRVGDAALRQDEGHSTIFGGALSTVGKLFGFG